MAKKKKTSPSKTGMEALIGQQVVFDTAGPITFLGTLREIRPEGYWLGDADIRDRTEGHVTKEVYVREARLHGIQSNRKEIFVFAHTVISCSALEDVIAD